MPAQQNDQCKKPQILCAWSCLFLLCLGYWHLDPGGIVLHCDGTDSWIPGELAGHKRAGKGRRPEEIVCDSKEGLQSGWISAAFWLLFVYWCLLQTVHFVWIISQFKKSESGEKKIRGRPPAAFAAPMGRMTTSDALRPFYSLGTDGIRTNALWHCTFILHWIDNHRDVYKNTGISMLSE